MSFIQGAAGGGLGDGVSNAILRSGCCLVIAFHHDHGGTFSEECVCDSGTHPATTEDSNDVRDGWNNGHFWVLS
ncbi:hypothetical protein StoSoilB20_33720 [Arthrobacter sp. StoSoilB20]|nr:hypothetical protein StoSoilB20_33720 [Arthrobacter sp. StoSoilB20]